MCIEQTSVAQEHYKLVYSESTVSEWLSSWVECHNCRFFSQGHPLLVMKKGPF